MPRDLMYPRPLLRAWDWPCELLYFRPLVDAVLLAPTDIALDGIAGNALLDRP